GRSRRAGGVSRWRSPMTVMAELTAPAIRVEVPTDGTPVTAVTSGAPADPFFSCRDIHAFYGESYIVQGVSFDVMEGEVLALLGRNGAGKTSTLRAIARAGTP